MSVYNRILFLFVNLLFCLFLFSGSVFAQDPSGDPPVDEPSTSWLGSVTESISSSISNIAKEIYDFFNNKWIGLKNLFQSLLDFFAEKISNASQYIKSWIELFIDGFSFVFNFVSSFFQKAIWGSWDFVKLVFWYCYNSIGNILLFFAGCFVAIFDFFSAWLSWGFKWFFDFILFLWDSFLDLLRFCWHFLLSNLVRFLDWIVRQFLNVWIFVCSFIPELDFGGSFASGLGYFISFGLILDDFIPIHEAFFLFSVAIVFRFSVVVFRFVAWVILEILP